MMANNTPLLGDVAVVAGSIVGAAIVIIIDLYQSGALATIARAISSGAAS